MLLSCDELKGFFSLRIKNRYYCIKFLVEQAKPFQLSSNKPLNLIVFNSSIVQNQKSRTRPWTSIHWKDSDCFISKVNFALRYSSKRPFFNLDENSLHLILVGEARAIIVKFCIITHNHLSRYYNALPLISSSGKESLLMNNWQMYANYFKIFWLLRPIRNCVGNPWTINSRSERNRRGEYLRINRGLSNIWTIDLWL